MNRITTVTIGLLMLAPLSALAQTQAKAPTPASAPAAAPQPGPEQKKLSVFLGDWTYVGETKATPLWPAGKVTGKSSARPILGGFFIQFQGEETDAAGNVVKWIEIDGYDPVKKRYTWSAYADGGSTRVVTYTLEGTSMKYEGTFQKDGKQFKNRGTVEFSADFMTNVEKSEVSIDGKKWMPAYELRLTKVKAP